MPDRPPLLKAIGLTIGLAALPGLILASYGTAAADARGPVPVPDSIKAESAKGEAVVPPSLRNAKGTVSVSVAMSVEPLAATVKADAITTGSLPSRTRQRAQTAAVVAQQDRVVREARKLGARSLGRATKAANVVAMSIPAKNIKDLAKLRGVVSVKPVARYELHADPGGSGSLAQAADYVQATSVRAAGYDGTGVKVAVLDSGIDFTHEYLGGPGTKGAYKECYSGASGKAYNAAPKGACAGLFGGGAPKVKGGYDFVGETWPDSAEAPDPNPIDLEGHGTHVSDIVGGRSADGTHKGIAPGVDLYGVKVCSAVATSCSGVALLQGVDWALDPNDDGVLTDAMDIVNLSLGMAYGQVEDDLSGALDNLVRAGVVAVASAGNNADRPFIVGSPSTSARVISVAQTALPDDKLYSIKVNSPTIAGLPGNNIRNSKLQAWSPTPTGVVSGALAQPSGDRLGCAPASFSGFPSGAVALVKRGTCSASVKAQNAQAAGASSVVIWNNVSGEPPDFSFGGGDPVTVPTYTISLDNGTLLSNAITAGAVQVTIDPAVTVAIRNTVVGTSSRGVAIAGRRAKPDIGAPGSWLSAEVGTGNGQTSFGGTSGSAPVVTGAAALVLDRYPDTPPRRLKARLLNGASTANRTPDADANLYATPISRIGAGEVRVAPAIASAGILRGRVAGSGNVGLKLPRLTNETTYRVALRLINTGSSAKVYTITPTFRHPADQAKGAVKVKAPAKVKVAGKTAKEFTVKFTINPKKLSQWPFTHSAGWTGDGQELNKPEFDGFVKAVSGREALHLGWTVLPHRAAHVSATGVQLKGGQGQLKLRNTSKVQDGVVNVFGLTGTSPRLPTPAPGAPGSPGSNVALIDLAAAGVRDDAALDLIQFAVAGHQRRVSPLYPAGYEVQIDTDRDGDPDYAMFQQEAVGFGMSGLSLVYVYNFATKQAGAYYYNDADFDSATSVLTAPLSALGLSAGSTFDFSVIAFDNYSSLLTTDEIVDQTWTVGSENYSLAAGADELIVPKRGRNKVTVSQSETAVDSTQTGLLLILDDARSRDFQSVRVTGGARPRPITRPDSKELVGSLATDRQPVVPGE